MRTIADLAWCVYNGESPLVITAEERQLIMQCHPGYLLTRVGETEMSFMGVPLEIVGWPKPRQGGAKDRAIIGACGACKSLLYHGDRTCPQCGAPCGESVDVERFVAYPRGESYYCSSDGPWDTRLLTSDGPLERPAPMRGDLA